MNEFQQMILQSLSNLPYKRAMLIQNYTNNFDDLVKLVQSEAQTGMIVGIVFWCVAAFFLPFTALSVYRNAKNGKWVTEDNVAVMGFFVALPSIVGTGFYFYNNMKYNNATIWAQDYIIGLFNFAG